MSLHTVKTTLRVLMRRKFFTAISLFCIATTLMVLIVVAAIVDNMLHPIGAERNFDTVLIVERVRMANKEETSVWSSPLGYKFIEEFILTLKTPERVGYYTDNSRQSLIDGLIQRFQVKYTDDQYAKIVELDFIDGRYFTLDELNSGQRVAIINEPTQIRFFGDQSAIGKTIEFSEQRYTVIGVVRAEAEFNKAAFSDIWAPITTFPSGNYRDEMMGSFRALIKAASRSDIPAIKAEFEQGLKSFDYRSVSDEYATATSFANTKLERMAREFMGTEDELGSGLATFLMLALLGVVLFMLLPAINLFNLSISRIMERASEIGVRKAFGAPRRALVNQFLLENIILTLIGGLMGLLLSLLALNLIESSGLIAYANFNISWRLVVWTLMITLLFALISGSYPAWRMARMHPVRALKGY